MKLYLCILENTMDNNIHENQILPLLEEDIIALFIAPLFIINESGAKLNSQKYQNKNIFHVRIPFSSHHFLLNFLLIPLLLGISIPIITYFVLKYDISTIHARNHVSSYISVITKKIFPYLNVISDFRGHYAEEGVIVGRWSANSFSFRIWKRIEKYICDNSDTISVISNGMMNYYKSVSSSAKIIYTPAIVDIENFYYSNKIRIDFRKTYNIENNEVVFIYVGSLGLWHNLSAFYAILEETLQKHKIINYRVFILSNINIEQARDKRHKKHNTIILTVKPHEVNKFLCGSDIGILPGTNHEGSSYDLLYRTMISSKVEEYLCTGLKVISHTRITEVVKLIESKEQSVILPTKKRISSSRKYQELFDSKIIKKQYRKHYR